jgi:hypothetical protein
MATLGALAIAVLCACCGGWLPAIFFLLLAWFLKRGD